MRKPFLTALVAWAIDLFDLDFEYCNYSCFIFWDALNPDWRDYSPPPWREHWNYCQKTGKWVSGWEPPF
jgi:hypothetical protein